MPIKRIFTFFYLAILIVAAALGLHYYLGPVLAVIVFVCAAVTRLTLILMIAAFFGLKDVWHWHWFFAAFFTFPFLVSFFMGTFTIFGMNFFFVLYQMFRKKFPFFFFRQNAQGNRSRFYQSNNTQYKTDTKTTESQNFSKQKPATDIVDSEYVVTSYYPSGKVYSKEYHSHNGTIRTEYYNEDGELLK